ncbi:MgtC/SapB family protein [Sulfitobacter sp. HGT1]|uniref:MgtC/SapB family protein n=1 Tax=Sulfitobacter sp. HGT1 TaxID=2735435 RepID=UPI0020CDF822|nr:MgtC/SapB family protein [Sulfitobacter sp. HGT1]
MNHIFSDLDMPLLLATVNMGFALVLGAVIGSERQFRGRMAGLRTNALVSLGAAGFVTFAALFPTDINPTRVAAQVVSGIGFLGAGIIFRDGFNIQGINTAATLWCAAAVGLISGTGHVLYAIALTLLIVFSNLGLRPIVRKLKTLSDQNSGAGSHFDLTFECRVEDEKQVRAAIIGCLGDEALEICQIVSRTDIKIVEIVVQVTGAEDAAAKVERTISKLSLSPGLLRAGWCVAEAGEIGFK